MHILEGYGYWGMTIAAFLAGSIFPFSSEAVMVSLQLAGLEPWPLFLSASVGNVAGSMFNYYVGTLGRLEWIERYLHIKRDKVLRAQAWMENRGVWMGTLCFLFIPSQMIQFFSHDSEVLRIGVHGFRIIGLSFVPMAVSLLFPVFFQAVGSPFKSSALTVIRTVFLFVPLGWLFARSTIASDSVPSISASILEKFCSFRFAV